MLLIEPYKRQSSAKRQTVDFTESGRSLIWHMKRRGPSTMPWDTPENSDGRFFTIHDDRLRLYARRPSCR